MILGLGCTMANAQNMKIGYVDSRAVSDKLPEVKQAYAQLGEFQKAKEAELKKDAEAFQKLVDEYSKEAEAMEATMRSARERELQAKQEQLQLKETNARADIQKRQQTIFDPIEKRIQEAIKTVAGENGYTYILAKEVLLHYPAGEDISEKVTQKLLASAPKANNAPKPAGSQPGSATTPKKN